MAPIDRETLTETHDFVDHNQESGTNSADKGSIFSKESEEYKAFLEYYSNFLKKYCGPCRNSNINFRHINLEEDECMKDYFEKIQKYIDIRLEADYNRKRLIEVLQNPDLIKKYLYCEDLYKKAFELFCKSEGLEFYDSETFKELLSSDCFRLYFKTPSSLSEPTQNDFVTPDAENFIIATYEQPLSFTFGSGHENGPTTPNGGGANTDAEFYQGASSPLLW